jgi:hypothetical protein
MNTDDVVIWFTVGEDLWSHTIRSYGHWITYGDASIPFTFGQIEAATETTCIGVRSTYSTSTGGTDIKFPV